LGARFPGLDNPPVNGKLDGEPAEWALRFWRLEKSISCVFSMVLNIPTPPASTIKSPVFMRVFCVCSEIAALV
jgi:hypothetical protein